MQKKTYSKPQLIVHGDVEAITQGGVLMNRDFNGATNNSASPNIS